MRKFHLVSRIGDDVFVCETLVEMWNCINDTIEEPKKYVVDEMNGYSFVDSIGAYTLIDMYKTEDDVPETLFEDEIAIKIKKEAITFKTWCDENVSDGRDLTNEQLYEEFIKLHYIKCD